MNPLDQHKVTIRHVARHAMVSTSTVSNVINGRSDKVKATTFERVTKSLRHLNYTINDAARRLRTGRASLVGLVVPSIADPFCGSLALALDRAAESRGYRLLFGDTHDDAERETTVLDDLLKWNARVAITTSSLPASYDYSPWIDRGLPVVQIGCGPRRGKNARTDCVTIDNIEAARAATRYLIQHGHDRLMYVTAPLVTQAGLERYAGFVAAVKEAGREDAATVLELETAPSEEATEMIERIAREFGRMRVRTTGVVGMTDVCAAAAISAARRCQLRVPQDVSVIGIDGLTLGMLTTPPLTSMCQPLSQMAEAVLDLVQSRVAEPSRPPMTRVFHAELVLRASVSAVVSPANRP